MELTKKREIALVILITILFLSTRLILFFGIEKIPIGDESQISTMGLRVFTHHEHPFYIYGNHYGGGASINAHISAVLFYLFGVSNVIPKITELLVTTILFFAVYLFARKYFGLSTALLTILFFALPSAIFSRYNVTVLGEYMPMLLLNVIIFSIFYHIYYSNEKRFRYYILLGMVCAIAWWNIEFVSVTIATMLLFWFLSDKLFFIRKRFIAFIGSFIVFLTPVIVYNIIHPLANIKNLFYGTAINKIVCDYHLLPGSIAVCLDEQIFAKMINPLNFLGNHLSSLFSSGKEYKYDIGLYSGLEWIYYSVFILSMGYLLWQNRIGIVQTVKSLFSKMQLHPSSLKKEFIILVFITICCVSYIFKGTSSVRYLLPIYPFVFIIISLAILKMNIKNILRFGVVIVLLCISFSQHIELMSITPKCDFSSKTQEINFYTVSRECVHMDLVDASDIISFLDENNITAFYASHDIQWQIIFQTRERIIGACDYLCPCMRFGYLPPYSEIVANSNVFAYIFNKGSMFNKNLIDYLVDNDIDYKFKSIDDFYIYYDMSTTVRPKEVLKKPVLVC